MITGLDITNKTKSKDEVLTFLHSLPNHFQLTGSRFFGNEKADSDYDFFVQHNFNLVETLIRFGFEDIKQKTLLGGGYDGKQFITILEYKTFDIPIQIQLVDYFSHKLNVQYRLKSNLSFFNSLTKEQRKEIWGLMLGF